MKIQLSNGDIIIQQATYHLVHPSYNMSSHLPYAFDSSDSTARTSMIQQGSNMTYTLLGEPLNCHVLFHKHRIFFLIIYLIFSILFL